MLVINLYGGPCVGKSTLAGDIFTKLKRAGVQAEIPPEIAKLHAQRGDMAYLADQLAVFGATQHQLNMSARSGAEVAVVDSPILLSMIYAPKPYLKAFPSLVREVYDGFANTNYVLQRQDEKGYSMVGRIHDEEEAKSLDTDVIRMLRAQILPFTLIDSSEFSAELVVQRTLEALGMAPQVNAVRRLRA